MQFMSVGFVQPITLEQTFWCHKFNCTHMLARSRYIGYYRKKGDRSSLCILCWINLTVHPCQNRLYVKGMRFYDSNCQSITVYVPEIIQRRTVMPRNMLRLVTERSCQSFSDTVAYIALLNSERHSVRKCQFLTHKAIRISKHFFRQKRLTRA